MLFWNLSRDYKARHWRASKDLAAIERELRIAQRAYHQVNAVRADWPEQFAALTGRIAGLTPRIEGLAAQLDSLVVRQARFLEGVATRELYAQRERLSTYLVQARFALASVYDRSATVSSVTPAADEIAGDVLP